MPFISDADLEAALKDAGVTEAHRRKPIVDENAQARIDGLRAALSVLAVLALVALFLQWQHPHHPGRSRTSRSRDDVSGQSKHRSY